MGIDDAPIKRVLSHSIHNNRADADPVVLPAPSEAYAAARSDTGCWDCHVHGVLSRLMILGTDDAKTSMSQGS
jgi:hypothetical protein